MQTLEFFRGDKYRDLAFGTVYYVAGRETDAINGFVQRNARRVAKLLNENKDYWVTCRIEYLEADNPYFEAQAQAVLYSPMLPVDDHEGTPFFVEPLAPDCPTEEMCIVFDAYFRTLMALFDKVLDGDLAELDEPEEECAPCECAYEPEPFLARMSDACGAVFKQLESPAPKRRQAKRLNQPSRLEITPYTYHVLLPDYDREIHFTAQVKALYVLFLNHPEGIRMKEIADYKQEYKQLYFYLTNRSDTDKLRDSVEKLLDVCNPNALNVKKSQCNDALCQAIPEEDLRSYYEIEVNRGQPHRIRLDRSLVSMPDNLHA